MIGVLFDEEMKMIGHEAVGEEANFFLVVFEYFTWRYLGDLRGQSSQVDLVTTIVGVVSF